MADLTGMHVGASRAEGQAMRLEFVSRLVPTCWVNARIPDTGFLDSCTVADTQGRAHDAALVLWSCLAQARRAVDPPSRKAWLSSAEDLIQRSPTAHSFSLLGGLQGPQQERALNAASAMLARPDLSWARSYVKCRDVSERYLHSSRGFHLNETTLAGCCLSDADSRWHQASRSAGKGAEEFSCSCSHTQTQADAIHSGRHLCLCSCV